MTWRATIDLMQPQQQERVNTVIDGHKILLIWHDDQVHAIQAQCPHFKLPLAKGHVTEKCAIVCPFHKSEFDLATGEVKCWSPWPKAVGNLLGKIVKPQALKIYPTRIEGDKILVEIKM